MKVGTKFALAFVATGFLTVVVYSSVAASREVGEIESTVTEDLASVGRTVGKSVVATYEADGEERARELVAMHDRDEVIDVRWTWLDTDGPDRPRAPSSVTQAVLHGGQQTWVGTTPEGGRRVYAYIPMLRPNTRPVALEFSRPLVKPSSVFWSELRDQLLWSTLAVAFAGAIAFLLTSMIVSRPLGRVAEQARRIGGGDLSYKVPVRGTDEVALLGAELNAMADALQDARTVATEETKKRLAALEQLRHADRLRTVGTLASGIAHELGTPLNVIAMRAKMIATSEVTGTEATDSARIIGSQTDRVTKIVRQLLDFARRKAPKRVDTDLGDVAERTMQLLSALARKARVELKLELTAGVRSKVDAVQIEQALTNLVINGIHAMPNGGPLSIVVREDRVAHDHAPDLPIHCAVLEVVDSGTGISPEHLERIFEPFFTTKGVGEGTGLGLSVAHGIIADHGGWMRAERRDEGGMRFAMLLPLKTEPHVPADTSSEPLADFPSSQPRIR